MGRLASRLEESVMSWDRQTGARGGRESRESLSKMNEVHDREQLAKLGRQQKIMRVKKNRRKYFCFWK